MTDTFSSGIDDEIRKIARKTVTLFGEIVLKEKIISMNVDQYIVKMERMGISDTIKVEVGIPKGKIIRWFLGMSLTCDKDEWIWRDDYKPLTTMEYANPNWDGD